MSDFYRKLLSFNANFSICFDLCLTLASALALLSMFPMSLGYPAAAIMVVVNIIPLSLSVAIGRRGDDLVDWMRQYDSVYGADLDLLVQMARKLTVWTAFGLILKSLYAIVIAAAVYVATYEGITIYPTFLIMFAGLLLSVMGGCLTYTVNRLEVPLRSRIHR